MILNDSSNSSPLLPYFTKNLPGIGGIFRASSEDFCVEEIPAYQPCGQGEHLYLWIEKKGLSTDAVLAHLAKKSGISQHSLGYAGKKDTQAQTRQWVSLHIPSDPDLTTFEMPGLRVLHATRHLNKLRLGHLTGNRFQITLREVIHPERLNAIVSQIRAQGFPNFFGDQRLGHGHSNVHAGREIVSGERSIKGNLNRVRFSTNALQSALFNRVVSLRLGLQHDVTTLLPGDLAVLHHNGAHFSVLAESLSTEQQRVLQGETSASAPMFGYKVPLASGVPGELESTVLAEQHLTLEDFRLGGKRVSPKGERRAIRALAHELVWKHPHPQDATQIVLEFRLDRGVYATTLLREVMKNDSLRDVFAP